MKYIIGVHTADLRPYVYGIDSKVPSDTVKIGDFAVVEDLNSYGLVEICGICESDALHSQKITGNGRPPQKKALIVISKEYLKNASEGIASIAF